MSASTFDATRFEGNYDFNNAQDLCRIQIAISDFMTLVREGAFIVGRDEGLAESFCRFVDREEVWHLAEMVVPEFRTGELEALSKLSSFLVRFLHLSLLISTPGTKVLARKAPWGRRFPLPIFSNTSRGFPNQLLKNGL